MLMIYYEEIVICKLLRFQSLFIIIRPIVTNTRWGVFYTFKNSRCGTPSPPPYIRPHVFFFTFFFLSEIYCKQMLTLWLYKYNGYIMNYLLPCYLLYFCHSVQQLCVSCVKKNKSSEESDRGDSDGRTYVHTNIQTNG